MNPYPVEYLLMNGSHRMRRSQLIRLLSICVILLTALGRQSHGAAYRTETNLLYRAGGNLDEPTKERCRLDVYYPEDLKGFSTVVWFHGGGLSGGRRSVPKALQEKGIAVVAAGYRLSPQVKSPAYIEDAAAAVAWTFRNMSRYGGATNRIFVSGHSAGGYLASMIGLDKRWLAAHDLDANRIAGLIPYSGQAITHFTVRAERGIPDTRPIVDELAPVFHVRKDAPPLLIISGDRELELLGRYEENAYLWRMMRLVGHPDTVLLELDGYSHGGMAEPAHPLLLEFIAKRTKTPVPGRPLVDVFVNGREGYPAYRIPALIATQRGSLLAFAEGRASLSDHAENDIVLKRSTDAGRSWSMLQVMHQDGGNSLGNPTAVVVRETGCVLLMYQRYAQGFDEHKAEPGLNGPRICRTLLQQSDDDGVTWSAPVEITAQVKRPTEVTSTATGPGIGIQLLRGNHAGRILMPFNQGPYGKWKVYAAISDDRGASWRYGETAPEGAAGYANEVQFVELDNGSVMLNARNQGGGLKQRKIAISRDGGESWSATQHDATLVEPTCQASILRHLGNGPAAKDLLLFSNPGTQTERTNGVIRLSRDEGKTWPMARVLYPGGFAYSCLASLPDGSLACLFERDGYQAISLARFSIPWVEGRE